MKISIPKLLFSLAILVSLTYIFYNIPTSYFPADLIAAFPEIFPLSLTIEEIFSLGLAALFLTFIWPGWLKIEKLKRVQKAFAPDAAKLAVFFFLAAAFISLIYLQYLLVSSVQSATFAAISAICTVSASQCFSIANEEPVNRTALNESRASLLNNTNRSLQLREQLLEATENRYVVYITALSPWGLGYLGNPHRFVWLALYWWFIAAGLTHLSGFWPKKSKKAYSI